MHSSIFLLVVIICGIIFYFWYRSFLAKENAAKELSKALINRINDALLDQLDVDSKQPYISINQLRDHLLRECENKSYRKKVWNLVLLQISNDSRIRKANMNIAGEPSKCWSWIGPKVLRHSENLQSSKEKEVHYYYHLVLFLKNVLKISLTDSRYVNS